ncbi:MAG: hypothetical protein WCI05_14590 [Myxococcales bacterium]|jgi:hypothetical protein
MNAVVVACRMPYAGIDGLDAFGASMVPYLERARGLIAKAEALGATLAAWGATHLAFSWDPDAVEEAVTFVTNLGGGQPCWACGMAEGEMIALALAGGRPELAWGLPLVSATALARAAQSGEVLVDASLRVVQNGMLVTCEKRVATDQGRQVRGWRLESRAPWSLEPDTGIRLSQQVHVEDATLGDETSVTLRAPPRPVGDVLGLVDARAPGSYPPLALTERAPRADSQPRRG